MNYLTLEMIKKQCRLDDEFTDDDILLESLGDGAEDFLANHLNQSLDDICAEYGGSLPPSLMNALLIYVSYSYDNDGSGETKPMPQAFWIFTKPWQKYTIA